MTLHQSTENMAAAVAEHTNGGQTQNAGRRRKRPLRTSLIAIGVAVVAATGVAAATGALGGDSDTSTSAAPSGPPKSAKVETTSLTRTETVNGNLGYGDATAVQAPPSASSSSGGSASSSTAQGGQSTAGSGSGVLTWLPAEGETIKRGAAVYSVDDRKVPLLYGVTPLYRTIQSGSEGKDVKLLEENLSALGYTGFTVDDEYTDATATAVKAWQEDLGREEIGTVAPGDAVVATGERRVADIKATSGGAPTGDILTWTGTERIVTVDLEVKFEDLVEDGTKTTIKLPDGTKVDATVNDVGTAATAAPAAGSTGGAGTSSTSSADATLPVKLEVKDQTKLGRYQAAPVDVTFEAETRKDVLAVPINALVALREGGYALETVGSTGIEYLPVELGMFAGGLVEVSGQGVSAGLVVGVPK
ncbi:peptidoglycan-binding domain-containing protein [Streptomyces sp. AP-93]|uniref:peptidoglycan-binding domain-containing protein n=1 Tax=Streptomyces sp. AP-93 TaxID=2929048 RepID=UPI001FAF7331|nr:peptidoglycan-binding domain-containing protein [Streptomyces sp. AP-93]MCJ0872630.1 peptidoglycan-binding protein [Streptomyces sp. AP-93]